MQIYFCIFNYRLLSLVSFRSSLGLYPQQCPCISSASKNGWFSKLTNCLFFGISQGVRLQLLRHATPLVLISVHSSHIYLNVLTKLPSCLSPSAAVVNFRHIRLYGAWFIVACAKSGRLGLATKPSWQAHLSRPWTNFVTVSLGFALSENFMAGCAVLTCLVQSMYTILLWLFHLCIISPVMMPVG